ncbi:MAG: L,D-transpeptidase family protein [bacterium]
MKQQNRFSMILGGGLLCATLSAAANEHAAVSAVKDFYQSAEAGSPCQTAREINPDYTTTQCDDLMSQTIRKIRLESSDNRQAKVFADIVYEQRSHQGQQHFQGIIQLINDSGLWRIQNMINNRAEAADAPQLPDSTSLAMSDLNQLISPPTTPTPATKDVEHGNTSVTAAHSNPHHAVLQRLQQQYADYAKNGVLIVDVSEQMMYVFRGDSPMQTFPISTATKGEGSQAGSDKTPLGAHRVSDRYGDGAPLGTIFKARQNTGRIAEIITEPKDVKHDYVTTRILWLDGLEVGKNKGKGIDSHDRYIYIHGTVEEGLIGQKASHGCIRMKNTDVVKLYQQIPVDALVYIQL